MDVELSKELQEFVQNRLESGRYASATEVVSAALDLLADRDEWIELRKDELRRKIAQGLESLRRGEGVDGEEFFAELAREEAALKSPTS